MKITKGCNVLIVVLALVPAVLFGFDLPGYITMHGKVIDADTLKPIEGAVVWAIWMKCRPGIGSGSCQTGMAKEVLTDASGEWSITGPKGNDDPGFIRSILGILVPWNESPRVEYYKPGYFPFMAKYISGDFSAYAYVDKTKNIEGIILIRMGDTKEQVQRYMDQWEKDRCDILIPVKDPERKLRELDFDFKYSENVKRIYFPSDITRYEVIGLKRAITPEEKREARSLGINGIYPDVDQSLLRKALKY
jgi:hypothetical protein